MVDRLVSVDDVTGRLPKIVRDRLALELKDPATEVGRELSATIGIVPGVVADDVTDNRAAIQAALDKGGNWRLPAAVAGRYAISGPLNMAVPGTQFLSPATPIRQTVAGQSVFNIAVPDVVIEADLIGSLTALNVNGMTTAWEMSIVSSRWTGINAYYGADRLHVPYLKAEGFSSAVRVTDWNLATGARAVAGHVKDVSLGELLCKNVEFGIVIHGTDRFSYESVIGSYCCPIGGTRPPHLIYFSGLNADNVDVKCGYSLATWEGGAIPGQAFQFKGVKGGDFGEIIARGCPGALNIMDSTGWTVDLESTDDASVDVYGSVSVSRTTGPEPAGTFAGFYVQMASNGIVYRQLDGAGIRWPAGMDVVANHATSGTAHDIEIRGTNSDISGGIRYNNVGSASWRAVGIYAGDGHRIGGQVVIRNARIGVEVRATATNTVLTQDPDITLHPTDGFAKFMVDPAAGPTLRLPSTPRATDRVLVKDRFTIASLSGVGPGVALTGQAWTSRLGTWVVDHNTGIIRETAGTAQSNIDIPSGSPNVEVNVWVKFKANDGITLRRVSNTEYLCIYLNATDVIIGKRDTALTTLVSVVDAHQVGRWYKLTAKVFGDRIDVYLDNVFKVGHTLATGDAAKFISGDHGLFCSASGGINGFMNYETTAL